MESAITPDTQVPTSTRTRIQSTRTLIQPQSPTIDAPSRVVSFVLGFALASVLAWVGNLPTGKDAAEAPVARKAESVASAVGSVVTPATPEPARPLPAADTTPSPAPPAAPSAMPLAMTVPQPRSPAAAAPAARRQPALSGYRGALVLSSSPDGAQVLLNGKVVGQTPLVLNDLPVGSRALVVRRDGYEPWSASVRIVANQRTPIRATLKPIDQPGG